jgi:hypothetical protein
MQPTLPKSQTWAAGTRAWLDETIWTMADDGIISGFQQKNTLNTIQYTIKNTDGMFNPI